MLVLPIEDYVFTLTRLRYLNACTQSVPAFKPDGKDAAYVSLQLAGASQALNDLLAKHNANNLGEGAATTAFQMCHDDCIAVYACMKSCYRHDTASSAAIRRLPRSDRSPEKTLARVKAIASLWATLPNVPGTNGPLVVGNRTQESFAATVEAFDTKLTAAQLAGGQLSGAQALFHQKNGQWDNFITAALVQGRAQFKPDSPERAYIDRVPTTPATQPPDQAEITQAQSQAAGAVTLVFNAKHATSFMVYHKGPGATEFTEAADVLLPGAYSATGLAAGAHQYQVRGENSRGQGPVSTVAEVTVAVAQVA